MILIGCICCICDWSARTVHGHLINLSGVVLLNVSQDSDVIILHKVDGHALTSITARPTNPGGGHISLYLQESKQTLVHRTAIYPASCSGSASSFIRPVEAEPFSLLFVSFSGL